MPKNKCYKAQLSLAVISNDDFFAYVEEEEAHEVLAEVSSCNYLMLKGARTYRFCLDDDGVCDYCRGDFEVNVEWQGTVASGEEHTTVWLVRNVDECKREAAAVAAIPALLLL